MTKETTASKSRHLSLTAVAALILCVAAVAAGSALAQPEPGQEEQGRSDPGQDDQLQADSLQPEVSAAPHLPLESLPRVLVENQFLGLWFWQWAGLIVLAAGAFVAARILTWLLTRILQSLAARTETTLDDRVVAASMSPLRIAMVVALIFAGSLLLILPPAPSFFIARSCLGLLVAAGAWLALRLIDVAAEIVRERLVATERIAAVTAVPLATRAAKAALVVVASIVLLQNLGLNVTGLIAGLGVGGLAIALAAQKSVANLFGGITLIADQPIRIGDFCRFGDNGLGTVEEIGIRSTRVRTLDRSLVTIPNAEFSEVRIENYTVRDRMRFFAVIGLRYETSPDQMRHILASIRRMLLSHPKVSDDPARARMVGFGSSSLDVEIFAYVMTADWGEFMQIREDLLLRIMDLVEESGTSFAFPSQTLYLGRDSGLDAGAARRAEEAVESWRKEGALPFPEYAAETKAGFRGSIAYPPEGSASNPAAGA